MVKSGRTTKITLKNLRDFSEDNPSPISLVDGTWHLKFKLDAENCSKELPAGQKISINGKSAVLDKLVLSPIGYNIAYTVDDEVQFEDAESGRAPASHRDTWKEFTGEQFITLKDGTTIDLASGGSMDPEDGKTYCVRQGTFEAHSPAGGHGLAHPSAAFPSRSSKNTAARHSVLPGGFAVEKLVFSANCGPFPSRKRLFLSVFFCSRSILRASANALSSPSSRRMRSRYSSVCAVSGWMM
ncbi:MAG: hypothetical protein ACLR4Z_11550 [Butyricicoccaceae bacterium]